jgi:hypothetical protein
MIAEFSSCGIEQRKQEPSPYRSCVQIVVINREFIIGILYLELYAVFCLIEIL